MGSCFVAGPVARRIGAAWIVAIAVSVSLPCYGGERDEARQRFEEGKRLFVEKQYEAALESFRASVDLYPTYNGYFNLANCHRAMQEYAEALDAVAEMAAVLGPSPRPEMRRRFAEFESSINVVVGTLRLSVSPAGATVFIDGREIGTAPLRKRLVLGPGYHEVVVKKAGFERARRHVQISSEAETAVSIVMEAAKGELFLTVDVDGALVTVDHVPVGKTPLVAALRLSPGSHRLVVAKPGYLERLQDINVVPGAKTAITLTLEPDPAAEEPLAPEARRDGASNRSWAFWSAGSGTLAAGVLGGVFWGMAVGKSREVQELNNGYLAASDTEAAVYYDGLRRDARERGLRYQKAAIGLTVATGVLAGATVAVFFSEFWASPDREAAARVDIAPGGVVVRF